MSGSRVSRRVRSTGAVVATLAVLNTVGAVVGALGLATGLLDLSDRAEARLPWSSPLLGGLALGLLVAVPNAALALFALRRDRRTPVAALVVGAGMVVWIAVELAFIRELSFFHPLYVAVGLVLMACGGLMTRSTAGERRDRSLSAR